MLIKDNSLTDDVLNIIRRKATERPFSGNYDNFFHPGTYLCRGCGLALFRAHTKFGAGCGWPSFDESLAHAVAEKIDADGQRTEITCARCDAHLGHVFVGEGFTPKNARYCVNASSLDFVEDTHVMDTGEAIVAGGCFWGVEYYLAKLPGVLRTEVGYTGGDVPSPSYDAVCSGQTGHFEAVRILYDPSKISYETVLKYFFEIHDPTQYDGQGPDRGSQYQSAVFFFDTAQEKTVHTLIQQLSLNAPIATQCLPVSSFWSAETLHQQYYSKTQHTPYCHTYTKRF